MDRCNALEFLCPVLIWLIFLCPEIAAKLDRPDESCMRIAKMILLSQCLKIFQCAWLFLLKIVHSNADHGSVDSFPLTIFTLDTYLLFYFIDMILWDIFHCATTN